MDDATADLIHMLQLQDLFDVRESLKGREDTQGEGVSDFNTAISLYIEELRTSATIISDQRFGRSVAEAEDPDHQLQVPHITATPGFDELRARLLDTAIEDPKHETLHVRNGTGKGLSDAWFAASLTDPVDHEPSVHEQSTEEGSTESRSAFRVFWDWFRRKPVVLENETADATSDVPLRSAFIIDCVACGEEKQEEDLMLATCGDHYCKACVSTLFDQATKDESLYPPRCCREPIPLSIARKYLEEDLVVKFERKAIEFGTLERSYCYDTRCSAFIPLEHIDGDKATCPECNLLTCKVCKSAAHENDCPEDPALEGLMAAAAAAGYQQCYQCKRLVELEVGCNHMTFVKQIVR
jgi:hypothetical protein